ncbi:MAG TPA: universal stress protein [Chitinophagaceae bacterium]
MHRIIIPVDFSDTSFNAARFAAQMLAGKKDALTILYHNYTDKGDQEIAKSYLESLKSELLEKGDMTVECEMEMGGDLVTNLDRLAHTRRATLITMGITGRSSIQQKFIGSNTLKTVDKSLYPVLIVPPDAAYQPIKNVAFASDFIDVETSTPSALICSVLEMFNPKLHIVNVNPEHYISITDQVKAEKEKLETLFSPYDKEFYFIGMSDFHDAINNFIRDYKIDMLITIPRHHSGSASLWKSTHTQKLAYQSHIPVLAAHE